MNHLRQTHSLARFEVAHFFSGSSGKWDWLRANCGHEVEQTSRTVPVPLSADVASQWAVEKEGQAQMRRNACEFRCKLQRAAFEPVPVFRLASTPVVLSADDGDDGNERTGVVSHRTTHKIQVAVNDWIEGKQFRLDRSADEITRKRQLVALSRAINAKGRNAQLRDIMFGAREPEFDKLPELRFETELNDSQKEAVRFAMSSRDLAIIHGPPGTGKTTTVVELIQQAVSKGQTVLASGPSNTSVDNLLMRLAKLDLNVVRIGHPARVARELQENTLDALVDQHENMSIAKEMIREAEAIFRKLDRYTRAKPRRGARLEMRAEAKQLKSDAKMLERQAVEHVLDRANVVCVTTTGDDDLLRDRFFDLVVVDEACQSTEPGC